MLRTFLVCTALAIAIAPAAGARDKPHPWDMHRQQFKSPGGGCPPGLEGRRWDCPPDRPGLRDTRRRPFELRRAEPAPLHPFERRYGRGDRVDKQFRPILDPRSLGLDPRYRYYLKDNRIYRVDPDTLEILAIIGLLDSLIR